MYCCTAFGVYDTYRYRANSENKDASIIEKFIVGSAAAALGRAAALPPNHLVIQMNETAARNLVSSSSLNPLVQFRLMLQSEGVAVFFNGFKHNWWLTPRLGLALVIMDEFKTWWTDRRNTKHYQLPKDISGY